MVSYQSLRKKGRIEYDSLKLLDKDVNWLFNNINTDLDNVFYGFYKEGSIYIIKNDDIERDVKE